MRCVQVLQGGGHLLPRADHQPHVEAVQRALPAQVGSDECVEEGWAKGKSKAAARPSACSKRGARLDGDEEAERLELLGQQGR